MPPSATVTLAGVNVNPFVSLSASVAATPARALLKMPPAAACAKTVSPLSASSSSAARTVTVL